MELKKRISLISLCVVMAWPLLGNVSGDASIDAFILDANRFFKQYVIESDLDYAQIKKNRNQLNDLIRQAETVQASELAPEYAKAFWINLYNIMVIHRIVAHYPVKSPKEIKGFFTEPCYPTGNKKLSLDDIEKKKLLGPFKDPRFHFILICGAKGCPPIADFAFRPQGLERQIADRTRLALNHPKFIVEERDKELVRISEIFRWYASDFPSGDKGKIQYINRYRKSQIPEHFRVAYITYDWSLNDKPDLTKNPANLRAYSPAILLPKKGMELKIFNNLYTQTAYRDSDGDKINIPERQSYFSMTYQFLFGVSRDRRVNIGFDINLKSVFIDPDKASPFNLFRFSGGTAQRTAITHIGPKIKLSPFKSLPTLSFQSTLLIPTATDLEGKENGKPYLEYDRFILWNQLFYDKLLSSKFQIFAELGFLFRLTRDLAIGESEWVIPASLFINYFPSSKITVYGMLQYSHTVGSNSTVYTQGGVGGKLQLSKNLELELLVTSFFAGRNSGAGSTYNLGIRYVKQ